LVRDRRWRALVVVGLASAAGCVFVGPGEAMAILAIGGFVAGMVSGSFVAVCVPIAAAGMAAVTIDVAGDLHEPFDLNPAVAVLFNSLVGLVGVPTAILGVLIRHRPWV
jgi:hypothetical protein